MSSSSNIRETVHRLIAVAERNCEQIFKSRSDASAKLCAYLLSRDVSADTVVFIPNGGAELGLCVARAMPEVRALALCPVQKVGSIVDGRYGLGALLATGQPLLNPSVQELLGGEAIDACLARARAKQCERIIALQYESEALNAVRGQRVLVVDDALASGYTMLAAIRSLQMHSPAEILCATPLASAVGADVIEREGVILHAPYIEDVGVFLADAYFKDFSEVTSDEVRHALQAYRSRPPCGS